MSHVSPAAIGKLRFDALGVVDVTVKFDVSDLTTVQRSVVYALIGST